MKSVHLPYCTLKIIANLHNDLLVSKPNSHRSGSLLDYTL